MPMRKALNQAFFKAWSPEMAYVLGYFAADGSMVRSRSTEQCSIEFKSTDKGQIERIAEASGSGYKISAYERGGNCRTCYRTQITSDEWYRDLTSLGFSQAKSRSLALPDIPKAYFGDFVRGYFDGDGCVYLGHLQYADRPKKRLILQTLFTSGSRSFLRDLHRSLGNHGVRGGSLIQKSNTRGFELKFSHNDSLALFRLMYHTLPSSGLCLPRKRGKLERAVRLLSLGE